MKRLAVLVVLTFLTGTAAAQTPFSGKIRGRVISEVGEHPLEGVTIDLRDKKANVAQTDVYGRFEIDLNQVAPEWAAEGKSLTLTFSAPSFLKAHRVLTCKAGVASECEEVTVPMVFDEAEIAPEIKEPLKKLVSREGYTLYLLPYEIASPVEGGPVAPPQTGYLARGLFMAIATHLQALASSSAAIASSPDISLEPLEIKMSWTNTEKIRRLGFFLNALAMIGGMGEVRRDEAGHNQVNISSRYIMIPTLKELPVADTVEDVLPADLLNSPRLSQKFNKLWLSRTVLAFSLRDFKRAKAKGDRQGIERVRSCLIAEKAGLTEEDKIVSQIDLMLGLVNKELGL
ncbi:hypothetical protein [Desulfobacca acetoxidans]|nr:hypothetical protein [Desulfobacterales bacterium]